MSRTLNIQPGVLIQAHGTNFRVEKVLDLDQISAVNLETHQRVLLSLADLTLDPDQSQRTHGRPNVHKISVEVWERVSMLYDALLPLASKEDRTEEDVRGEAEKRGMSTATLYRKLAAMNAIGSPHALLRRTGLGAGYLDLAMLPDGKSPSSLDEIVIHVAKDLLRQDARKSEKAIVNQVVRLCKELEIRPRSPGSVRRRVAMLPPKVQLAIRKGRKKSLSLVPLTGSYSEQERPYQVFQIDHTKLDVIIVDSEFRRPIGRAWITLLIEVCTRTVPGLAVALEAPSVSSISTAIRHAVLRKDRWLAERDIDIKWLMYGKPVAIHADNAKEFRGDVLRRVCGEHGMNLIWRPVKRPHYGAHIERLNGTLATILKDVKGATYSSPQEKYDYDAEGNAFMTLDELERWLVYRIAVVYHRTPHAGLSGVTPLAALQNAILGTEDKPGIGLPPLIKDERRLYLDFLPRQQRAITPKGARIDGVYYFADHLRPFIGSRDPGNAKRSKRYTFARDDRQIAPIYFFDETLNDYVDIPYADLSRPQISRWELDAARAAVVASNGDSDDEDEIFRAHAANKQLEQNAAEKSKKARRNVERARNRQAAVKPDQALAASAPAAGSGNSPQAGESETPAKPRRERKISEIEERE